jgi:hypothetical protein
MGFASLYPSIVLLLGLEDQMLAHVPATRRWVRGLRGQLQNRRHP